MSSKKVNCSNIEISNDNKICIIAGPCQLETEQHAMDMAGQIKEIRQRQHCLPSGRVQSPPPGVHTGRQLQGCL
mgnify:CR=1 FL=1